MTNEAADDAALADAQDRLLMFAKGGTTVLPLYRRLAEIAGEDPDIAVLMLSAPLLQRLPVLLLAAIHLLLLDGADAELRQWYPNLVADPRDAQHHDPGPALRRLCRDHGDALARTMATRQVQTNEVGRCAMFLPVLAIVASQHGPISLLDVGASGGLNLNLDQYGYHWSPHDRLNTGSPVHLECEVRGALPVPHEMPPVAWRRGLDRSPVDLKSPDQTRWLEACIWPEQTERAANLRAALALATKHPVDVRQADAVTDLRAHLDEAARHGHPVVTNCWVLNYLSVEQRQAYLQILDDVGGSTDLSWIYAESPAQIEGLPRVEDEQRQHNTVLSLVRWQQGERSVMHLADTHPHGRWIEWRPRAG